MYIFFSFFLFFEYLSIQPEYLSADVSIVKRHKIDYNNARVTVKRIEGLRQSILSLSLSFFCFFQFYLFARVKTQTNDKREKRARVFERKIQFQSCASRDRFPGD